VEAGRATPDAVFRARADWADVEQRLAEARDDEDAAARAFNQLLRRPLGTLVDTLPDSLFRFEIRLTEDDAVARALAEREELAQLNAGIRAADAGVRAATASFVPNVALALDYGVQGQELSFSRDNDFAVASVVLSWNLFNGGQDLARRQGAQADAGRLRLRRAEVEDLVRLDVTRAYRAAVVARDAISTAEVGLAAARRSFELVRRRYEEGLASQVEFLDARTSFTNAELNRVITVYRYAIRYVDLERAAALRDLNP
jgi:outer membrane protein TolC